MASYRKRPWLNPKDQSQYEVKAIHGFNVDLDGRNWYEVEWEPHKNGRPWRGGNFTWQREAVLVADGARKPIREFWVSESGAFLNVDDAHTKPLFKAGLVEAQVNRAARHVAGNHSDVITDTADDTTSEFSSANSESGLGDRVMVGVVQNDDVESEALAVFTGEESVENGVVVGESFGSEDDVSEEEFSHGSLVRPDPNEEMPNCDEQTDDVTASD